MKEKFYFCLGTITIVLFFSTILYAAFQEEKQWQAFKVEHQCKVTAHVASKSVVTYGTDSNGNTTTNFGTVSAQTGWTCDDGITYYR